MALLLVLVSLIASSAADGYPRERPSPQDDGGGPNSESSPQSSSRATPSPPPAVPSPSPVAFYGPTATPVVLPDGHIADTAAVAAARAHLAALDKAKALRYGAGGSDDGSYDPYRYGDYAHNYNSILTNLLSGHVGTINPNLIPTYLQNLGSRPYYGPMDVNLGIPKGYIAEAKAAQMARDTQLRALERARINAFLNGNIFPFAGYYPSYVQSVLNATKASPLATLLGGYSGIQGPLNRPYFGPLATPTVLPTGYLADTPEVAAARAAHLATLLKAKALWDAKESKDTLRYGQYDQQLYNILRNYNKGSFSNPTGVPKDLDVLLQGSLNTPFGGYLANPALPPPGYLENTPLAKAVQISALARAAAEASLWRSHQLYKRSN